MSLPVWQLEEHQARLRLDQWTARLDLSRPAEGLLDIRSASGAFGDLRLLGVEIPSCTPADGRSVIERHVRGADLVATYRESEGWPIRVDALWRAVAGPAPKRSLATVELVVSVWTYLLEVRPELAVQSVVPTAEVLRLVDADSARFELPGADTSIGLRGRPLAIEPAAGPGCLVFRLPETDLSYAEMVHPADFRHDELTHGPDSTQAARVRHRLFSEPLEKGVIFRARVRGIFCHRQDDTQIAATCYRAFAGEEPPLAC